MSLRKLDLNLLTVFDAIYVEGNLTRAASHIGMSQPAMSNALNRLRHVTKDDLFVRDGRGLHPTPVATELAPIIRQALNLLEMGLETTPGLKAGRLQAFSIAGLDYYEVVILPRLLAVIEDRAPGTTVKAVTGNSTDMEKPLRFGDIDLLIDYVPLGDKEFRCEVLFVETRVVLMDKDTMGDRASITLEEFATSGHVNRAGREGDERLDDIDTMLGKAHRRRDIQVTINNWLAMPAVLAGTKLIGVAPSRIAELYAPGFGLAVVPLPLEVRPIPIYMIWHESRDDHHAHRWLRAQLKRVCRNL
jgi:DNA-binding transcriptional LysR family regulator